MVTEALTPGIRALMPGVSSKLPCKMATREELRTSSNGVAGALAVSNFVDHADSVSAACQLVQPPFRI